MLDEVIHYLAPKPGGVYVDGTLGGAGHSSAIIEKIKPDGILIGIDQDIDAIRNAEKKLNFYQHNTRLVHDNFAALPDILLRHEPIKRSSKPSPFTSPAVESERPLPSAHSAP